MGFRGNAIRTGNRFVDLVLGVRSEEVLNPGGAIEGPDNPAAELMRVSKDLQAEAIDPDTGLVDYSGLNSHEIYTKFKLTTQSLPLCMPNDIGTGSARLAFWINVYNVLIIDAVIHYQIRGSMMRRPGIFRQAAYNIGGMRFSAEDIEHGILRGNQRNPVLPMPPFSPDDNRIMGSIEQLDPRIHFTLVCGAHSCPPINHYIGDNIDDQLDAAAGAFINGGAIRYEPQTNTLWLSKIFHWYKGDFGGEDGVTNLLMKYVREDNLLETLRSGDFRIRYMKYDWSVNSQK